MIQGFPGSLVACVSQIWEPPQAWTLLLVAWPVDRGHISPDNHQLHAIGLDSA